MKIKSLKKITGNFLVFTKNDLKSLEPRQDVLDGNIKYWLKNKELIALKKGVYVLKEEYEKEPKKDLYLEYIANRLVEPSYLSLEYVLAKFQLLSEPAQAITSITVKSTREIANDLATFRFYSIMGKLFTGYKLKYFSGAPVFEAVKEKALFDYLYLRFLKNEPINLDVVLNLRLNWENVDKKEFASVSSYLRFAKSKRLEQVFELIRKEFYA